MGPFYGTFHTFFLNSGVSWKLLILGFQLQILCTGRKHRESPILSFVWPSLVLGVCKMVSEFQMFHERKLRFLPGTPSLLIRRKHPN